MAVRAIWTEAQTIYVSPGLYPKCWPLIRKRHYPKPTLQTPARVPVARWCLGISAAPWTDSLANTGNCDGQGCTLPLHCSLHKSSKVCQPSPAASGTSAAPYCSSHKQGRAARRLAQCQILLHLPNCFRRKHWQRCYHSLANDVLLLSLCIASIDSDANITKLCQALIKTLSYNPLLQEMTKRPKCPDGALITFIAPYGSQTLARIPSCPK